MWWPAISESVFDTHTYVRTHTYTHIYSPCGVSVSDGEYLTAVIGNNMNCFIYVKIPEVICSILIPSIFSF